MSVYLRAKFEVSSIILTSFGQGEGGGRGNFISRPPQNEPLKSPARLGLKNGFHCVAVMICFIAVLLLLSVLFLFKYKLH